MKARLLSVGFRDMGVINDPGKNCVTGLIEADIRWDLVGEGV